MTIVLATLLLAGAGSVISSAPASSLAAAPALLLQRVVVQEVEVPADLPRLQGVFTASLVSELRKLVGLSVAGMDEVRALLEQEAARQLVGCEADGCLAEIASALGADIVVTARLTRLGNDSLVVFRRLDAQTGKAMGFDRRLPAGNGEEFLATIGPAVQALFAELPLRAGVARGVNREAALRLNPPPLPPWLFVSLAASSATALGVAAAAGGLAWYFTDAAQQQVQRSTVAAVDAVDVKRTFEVAQASALATYVLLGVAAVSALAASGCFFFTDFAGLGDAP